MTTKIAITGKSGSGKTTITKAFYNTIKEKFPEKSILLFDNDLTGELGHTFGLDIRNTIYGIRSGKHEYRTGIPQHMTKQEYVEWAMEDIIVPLEDDVDIIVSWLGGLKDCRCPITAQISYAIKKVISRYDFVIFDCEFDLKYLNQLVDTDIDLALIIANSQYESLQLAKRIDEFSAKYAVGGQMGVVINKADSTKMNEISEKAKNIGIEILGTIPVDDNIMNGSLTRESKIVTEAINNLYCRLNLPQ